MPEKITHNAHGLAVDVMHARRDHPAGLVVWEITAEIGGTKHTHVVTVGAEDGPRPAPLSAGDLQAMLDVERQKAASEAAWKEIVRSNAEKVK